MEGSGNFNEETRPLDESVTQKSNEPTPALPPLGILAGLSDRSLSNLSAYGRYHRLAAGTELIRGGELQDRFFVVVSGQLTISSRTGGKEMPLSTAKAGECLGEVSLLEPGPASATVRVVEDATLWSMDIGDLRAYLSEHAGGAGALLMGMATCLSKRLRQANHLIAQHHKLPVETLPQGRERAITASNTPMQLGFFDRLTQSIGRPKKVHISTKIKM
ncbi:MAG: cyclic nucleotide-binding domain-containing protein [Methylacidiphilales bacterium]|nr:cyclic nucleotide-binding domain-containing protein [Candidatus Methylacidiphilales bacterium]